jgi:hypothetical protein
MLTASERVKSALPGRTKDEVAAEQVLNPERAVGTA